MANGVTYLKVKEAIEAKGGSERLVQGNGYLYFCDGASKTFGPCNHFAMDLQSHTVDGWVSECERLRSAAAKAAGVVAA